MSYWHAFIHDFRGLVEIVAARIGKRPLATKLSHDIHTIKRWLKDGEPTRPDDVGWVIRLALLNGIDVDRFQTFAPIYKLSTESSYELNLNIAPPDFSWLSDVQRPPEIPSRFCGISLPSPLGLSASPLTANEHWMKLMLGLGYGLSTFKTRRTGQCSPYAPPQIAYVKTPPELSEYSPERPPDVEVAFTRTGIPGFVPNLVNSLGIPSENPSDWRAIYERASALRGGRFVGISIVGDAADEPSTISDWKTAVARARECKPPFIELNFSCPNLKGRADVFSDPPLVKRLCQDAAALVKQDGIPLAIKLPHLPEEMLRDILRASAGLVQAISLRNTIRVRPFEIEENGGHRIPAFKGREFGGLSGPCTYSLTVQLLQASLAIRKELGLEFDLIVGGGVARSADVVELLNLGWSNGANVIVQATNAPIFDPLLAWKLRYHLEQVQIGQADRRGDEMLAARDSIEIASLKNAVIAQTEINKKPRSTLRVSDHVLAEKWNSFILERSRVALGKPAKPEPPRSVNDWIAIFTSDK
jgi:dihydroorotate dehydrogenase (NAD+) catalytic subunit